MHIYTAAFTCYHSYLQTRRVLNSARDRFASLCKPERVTAFPPFGDAQRCDDNQSACVAGVCAHRRLDLSFTSQRAVHTDSHPILDPRRSRFSTGNNFFLPRLFSPSKHKRLPCVIRHVRFRSTRHSELAGATRRRTASESRHARIRHRRSGSTSRSVNGRVALHFSCELCVKNLCARRRGMRAAGLIFASIYDNN